jgi:hypothetical protein
MNSDGAFPRDRFGNVTPLKDADTIETVRAINAKQGG